ncbi:Uncharacterised protein [Legionella busanensis]|uniref:Coiled-coil protein n=1 Tax=Legionella busanensis TaxID=190655 RepID=A0A378JG92_9GAMM|nr:hypothetical protein [Legionella busanensis]STX50134.1 Uncharacterised protein [Legionella busanensis]
MTAVMRHLQKIIPMSPLKDKQLWQFSEQLNHKKIEFFLPLIKQHNLLNLEYNVLCTQLVHNYTRKNYDPEQLKAELITALMMAELLAYLYQHYLVVPREVMRLQKEQEVYRHLLIDAGIKFPSTNLFNIEPSHNFTQKIRGKIAQVNWLRLFLVRSKRVLNTCVPLAKDLEKFCLFVATVDKYANPVVAYLGWVFFIPRLSTNLFLLFKHLIPGFWMDEKEKSIGWTTRFHAQLQRRWPEIGNDIAWMTGGILNCFILLGPLAPFSVYVNVGLFGYDVLLASIRAMLEIKHLHALKEEYNNLANSLKDQGDNQELVEIYEYQQHLDAQLNYEYKRLLFGVCNTTALLLAASITIPIFVASPIVPFISALLLVSITVAGYLIWQNIEKKRPSEKVEKHLSLPSPLTANSFFASKQGIKKSIEVDIEPLNSSLELNQM